jgi:hypothetical protein
MSKNLPKLLLGLALGWAMSSASANVIADWDAKALAVILPASPVPLNQREATLVHLAMFDAINSIERRYRPYVVALPAASTTSPEAAAASAAASVLVSLHPEAAGDIKATLATYLAGVPEGDAKTEGLRLGAAVAAKIIEARADDGATAPDAYRPKTRPGVYVPTPLTVGWAWTTMRPFALEKPSQFRPGPPPALDSREWAASFDEIKAYGSKTSAARSPQQTEAARFWLAVGPAAYHQLPRQLIVARKMSTIDSSRFMALYAIAVSDALAAVYEAKYHYELWRPITAIRNGDDASAATWQPIDNTPMHPEYPCAHCISAGAAAAVIEAVLGSKSIPEIAMTSTTAPGVTHRWSDLDAFCAEVANARVWAGFHYRFSTVVGTDMGLRVGNYVVQNVIQPVSPPTLISGPR